MLIKSFVHAKKHPPSSRCNNSANFQDSSIASVQFSGALADGFETKFLQSIWARSFISNPGTEKKRKAHYANKKKKKKEH